MGLEPTANGLKILWRT